MFLELQQISLLDAQSINKLPKIDNNAKINLLIIASIIE